MCCCCLLQEIAYFHDPNKGTPSEGSVTKNLR